LYNEITEIISKPAENFEEAVMLVKEIRDRMPIGVFYKVNKPVFHREFYGDWNPVKDKVSRNERLKLIEEFV
jgi:hypothetical protein